MACYEYPSHFLLPVKSKSVRMFAVERQYPVQCRESNMDAFENTLFEGAERAVVQISIEENLWGFFFVISRFSIRRFCLGAY